MSWQNVHMSPGNLQCSFRTIHAQASLTEHGSERAPANSSSCLIVLFITAALGAMGRAECNRCSSISTVSGRFSQSSCVEHSCASQRAPPSAVRDARNRSSSCAEQQGRGGGGGLCQTLLVRKANDCQHWPLPGFKSFCLRDETPSRYRSQKQHFVPSRTDASELLSVRAVVQKLLADPGKHLVF